MTKKTNISKCSDKNVPIAAGQTKYYGGSDVAPELVSPWRPQFSWRQSHNSEERNSETSQVYSLVLIKTIKQIKLPARD